MKMLDLFCCEGIGAWGYWLSGRFSEIVGVDLDDDRRLSYSFDFIQKDALTLDYDFLSQFDFIHASPPCQAYSHLTPDKSRHMRLIAATKLMLHSSGKPHVIENVRGSIKDLRPNLVMDGHYFGLPSERQRYFYVSTLEAAERLIKPGRTINVHGRNYVTRDEWIEALGLNEINARRLSHMTISGMRESIPPVMTKKIAELMFSDKFMIG
jgi:DNA (cytosine-5)-methyltransferase 1